MVGVAIGGKVPEEAGNGVEGAANVGDALGVSTARGLLFALTALTQSAILDR